MDRRQIAAFLAFCTCYGCPTSKSALDTDGRPSAEHETTHSDVDTGPKTDPTAADPRSNHDGADDAADNGLRVCASTDNVEEPRAILLYDANSDFQQHDPLSALGTVTAIGAGSLPLPVAAHALELGLDPAGAHWIRVQGPLPENDWIVVSEGLPFGFGVEQGSQVSLTWSEKFYAFEPRENAFEIMVGDELAFYFERKAGPTELAPPLGASIARADARCRVENACGDHEIDAIAITLDGTTTVLAPGEVAGLGAYDIWHGRTARSLPAEGPTCADYFVSDSTIAFSRREPARPTAALAQRMQGDLITFDLESTASLWRSTCSGTAFEKRAGEAWVPVADERPGDFHPGYYLDDVFVPASQGYGCDVVACVPLGTGKNVASLYAYEYVKTGTKAPPADAVDSPSEVDVIETRPLSGPIRIAIGYFTDSACMQAGSVSLELTIPSVDEGVCCPIGDAGCSSEGPGGGWAPTLDACPPWSVEYDAMSVTRDDPRGCPKLEQDYDVCCGCVPADDGT